MKASNHPDLEVLTAYTEHVGSRNVQLLTVKRHSFCLEIFLDYLEARSQEIHLASLTPSDILDFVTSYAQTHEVDCRRHMRTMLRCFLPFAYQQQWVNQDLSAAVPSIRLYRLSRAPRPISEQNIEELLKTIDRRGEAGCRDFSLIQLLRIYGVRAIQLRHLNLTDIDWHNDTIQFPIAKDGHTITMPLLPEAGNALTDYLWRFRKSHNSHQELFLTAVPPYQPLAAATISGCIKRRIKAAEITLEPGVKPGTHAFRYACATRMLTANCSLKVVADTLGHRHFDSVQHYNKLNTEALRSLALPWPEEN